jgi:hypothetical protein
MSNYTVQLRKVINSGVKLFDFEYSFFDANYKSTFEQHFIDHFYMRELGSETVGLFKHYLKRTFNEILPYYNELFKTATINYEKLNNVSLSEEYSKLSSINNNFEGTGTNTIIGSGTDTQEQKYSDTPQGNVANIDNGYLTNYTKDTNTNNTSSSGNSTQTSNGTTENNESFTKTTKGNSNITQTDLLTKHIELQKTLQNIEKMFFEECNDLFMLLY